MKMAMSGTSVEASQFSKSPPAMALDPAGEERNQHMGRILAAVTPLVGQGLSLLAEIPDAGGHLCLTEVACTRIVDEIWVAGGFAFGGVGNVSEKVQLGRLRIGSQTILAALIGWPPNSV
jgi:hypothetical protein